jgi:hypothetical protein
MLHVDGGRNGDERGGNEMLFLINYHIPLDLALPNVENVEPNL